MAASPKCEPIGEITTGLGPTLSFEEPEIGFLGPPKVEQVPGD